MLFYIVIPAVASGLIWGLVYLFKWRRNRQIISYRGRMLEEINSVRRKHNCPRIGRTQLLDRVAVGHARSMAKRRKCDHNGFGKRSALIESRTGVSHIAENCYMYPASRYDWDVGRHLVLGWLRSSGHRKNLLNPSFRRTGIGIKVRKGQVYAAQIFTD